MKEVVADKSLIAYCGLYCGACDKYLNEKCLGCAKNEKATWCKTRTCCIQKNYLSCADCKDFPEARDCKKFNNVISKIFGLIMRSDRPACIDLIKKKGYESFAQEMAQNRAQGVKR